MSPGLRISGHPLHAALSDFPMVLLLLWVALDVAALVLGSPLLWMLGRWALIGGLVAAVIAASVGFLDYLSLGETKPRAVYRGAVAPTGLGLVLHLAALGLVALGLVAGGWLGGHLVFHFGVGVQSESERGRT